MNSDTSTFSSKADNPLVTTNSTATDENDDLELLNICDMLHDTRLHSACEQNITPRQVTFFKSEPISVKYFETPMRILLIQTPVRYQPTDAIDDRVILQYDPGGNQEK